MSFKMIFPEDIKPDFSFRFTTPKLNKILCHSIAEHGVLNPLPVLFDDKIYQLTGGFSRYEAAVKAGHKRVPVRIYTKEMPLPKLFEMILNEHVCLRPLNLIEKARVLSICRNISGLSGFQSRRIMRQAEIPASQIMQDDMEKLLLLPLPVQSYIEDRGLSLKQTEMFGNTPEDDLLSIIQFAEAFKIRSVELAALIDICRDISLRESCAISSILELSELLDNRLNRTQNLEAVKKRLHARRYPDLSGLSKKITQKIQQMSLPEGLEIHWDRQFERPGITLSASIADEQELGRMLKALTDEHHLMILRAIINEMK